MREALGAPFRIEARRPGRGGCINECYLVRSGGRSFFVTLNRAARADTFAAEAAGLEEILRTGAVRVPRPLCCGATREAA